MPRLHVLLSGHMLFYGLACIAAAIFSCALGALPDEFIAKQACGLVKD